MIYEIIQQNFIGVAITSFLLLFILTNNNFEKRINQIFCAAAVCVLVLIAEEAWEAQLAKEEVYAAMRVPLSALGYTLRPIVPFLLVLTVRKSTWKRRLLLSIPLVINALVSFSALFGKWAFSYSQDNQFIRGPLGIIPFITAGFYVVILLGLTAWEYRNGGIMEAMIVSAIVLLAVVATVMESVFKFRAIQSAGFGTSITFYYLFLHTNRSNRDVLTGALTRRRFYVDAEKYRASLTAVISMDLNDLKKINDQYGHMEGDKALITITKVFKRCIIKHAVLYRTGGDEFMVLCHKMPEEKVKEQIKRFQEELKKTEYRCAIGYAMYSGQQELDDVCQNADYAMYEHKKQMKSKTKMAEVTV